MDGVPQDCILASRRNSGEPAAFTVAPMMMSAIMNSSKMYLGCGGSACIDSSPQKSSRHEAITIKLGPVKDSHWNLTACHPIMSVGTNSKKKMTIEIRKRQMGLHSLTVRKDSDAGFKKEANAEVPNYPLSILRPAGTTRTGCRKTKTDWLAVQRRAPCSHVRQTSDNVFLSK